MTAEFAFQTELFPTLCTCERFLPCVKPLVYNEVALPCKAFSTHCTCVRFLPCMNVLLCEVLALSTALFPNLVCKEAAFP
ncbi:hypothetical protein FKM82_007914 [Ascaphus truei]